MVALSRDLPLWGRCPAGAEGAARADRKGQGQSLPYLEWPPQSLRDGSPRGGAQEDDKMGISRIACNLRELPQQRVGMR